MRYTFTNRNGTHVVEIDTESDKTYLLRIIRDDGGEEYCRVKKNVVLTPLPKSEDPVPDFDYWVTTPFAHQKEFLRYAMTHDNMLLLDEPGLGKTKQALDLIVNRKRAGQINRALIVCCVAGLQYNWLNEVKKHTELKGYILGTRPKKKNSLQTRIGSSEDKLFDLDHARADILICNIESFRNPAIVQKLQLMVGKGDIGQIIVDEIHLCKNKGAKQTAGLFSLNPLYKLGLTGTPIVNSPLDLFAVGHWMGCERRNLTDYKAAYCVMGGFKDKEVVGYQNLDDLSDRLSQWSLRRRKSECIDLPEKTVYAVSIPATPGQVNLYNQVLEDIRDRPEDILALPTPMGRFIGLRKVTGCPNTVLESYNPFDCAKAIEAHRLITEALDNGQKVVVFTEFVFTLRYLNTYLQNQGIRPAMIYGEMSLEERAANEAAFQTNPECKVLLGNYATLGLGLNLTAASLLIEYELPWTKADEIQAQDRCHRIGQQRNLTCVRLITKDTVDERVEEVVDLKASLAGEVVDRGVLADIIKRTLEVHP